MYEEICQFIQLIVEYCINVFFELFIIECLIKNRYGKLYFDYLQYVEGKMIICFYLIRGNDFGIVVVLFYWYEVQFFLIFVMFMIDIVVDWIKKQGCLFFDFYCNL